MAPLLEIDDLSVTFDTPAGDVHAVKNLSLSVERGAALGIVGESGSGKSVSMKAVMDLLPSKADITGDIRFDGTPIASMDKARRKHFYGVDVAMVFQNPMTSLNPVKRIADQLTEGMKFHQGMSSSAANDRAHELLDLVRLPDPKGRARQYPHELSGGMRQRVVIAMALANNPQLLIADEPTTALDVTVQREILDLLDGLRHDLEMAMILITHDLGVVSDRSDNVVVMFRGDTMETVPTANLFDDDRHPYTRSLRDAMPDITQARGGDPSDEAEGTDGPLAHLRGDEAMIRAEHLTVDYPGPRRTTFRAVDDVSFDVMAGETLGIVGESGCGKSTTAKSIMQIPPPTSGAIRYGGTDLSSLDKAGLRKLRTDLQLIFQDPISALNPRRSVWDIISEGVEIWGTQAKWTDERLTGLLERVGIDRAHRDRKPFEFSGGQCQRINIARALALDPSVLICDEPVSALDVSVQAQVLELLDELKAEHELTMLFISHDLAVVRNIADRVMVMYFGKVVEIGDTDSIFERAEHPDTKRLLAAVPGLEALAEGALGGDGEASDEFWKLDSCPHGPDDAPILQRRGPDHFVACHHGANSVVQNQ